MKKKIAAILVMALLLCSCSRAGEEKSEVSLYDKGLEIISVFNEMAESSFFSSQLSNESFDEITDNIRNADYTKPAVVYCITFTGEYTKKYYEMYFGEEMPADTSSEVIKIINDKLAEAHITMINSAAGVNKLTAAAAYTVEKVFVSNGLEENKTYIYMYEDEYPAAVTFIKGEDGAVKAVAQLILSEEFYGKEAGEVEEYFKELTEANIAKIEKIDNNKYSE